MRARSFLPPARRPGVISDLERRRRRVVVAISGAIAVALAISSAALSLTAQKRGAATSAGLLSPDQVRSADAIESETLLRVLFASLDTAYLRRDSNLLDSVFDPTFPSIESEAARVRAEGGQAPSTKIEDVRLESVAAHRRVVVATFGYDGGPERARVLLIEGEKGWRIGGIQSQGGERNE